MKYFLFIVIFSASLKVSGQVKLAGKVLDAQHNAVELATVKLAALSRIAVTNDSGYFHMTLPSGLKMGDKVTLNVSKEGYRDAVKTASVSNDLVIIILGSNTPPLNTQKSVPAATTNVNYLQNSVAKYRTGGELIKRKLDKESLQSLFYYLTNKNENIRIICIADDSEALNFATQAHDLLTLNGYKKVSDVAVVSFDKPVTGQFLNRDASGVTITIGHKPAE